MQIDQAKFSRGLALIANRGMRITVGRAAAEDAVRHVRDVAQAWLDDNKDSGPVPRPNDGAGGQRSVAAQSGQNRRAAPPSPNDREGVHSMVASSGQHHDGASRSPIGEGEGQMVPADKATGDAPSSSPSQQDARGQLPHAGSRHPEVARASSPINGRAGANVLAPATARPAPPRPAVVPKPVPRSPERKAMMRAADAAVMRRLKDTRLMHDKRPVGDLLGGDVERYKAAGFRQGVEGMYQAALLLELERIGIPPARSRLRDVYSDADFDRADEAVRTKKDRLFEVYGNDMRSLFSSVA